MYIKHNIIVCKNPTIGKAYVIASVHTNFYGMICNLFLNSLFLYICLSCNQRSTLMHVTIGKGTYNF